jgi:multidrug efflux pump subunit AcrB
MLEKSILNILENPKKKTIIFAAMIGLFLFSIATFPLEIVKAKMLPGKDSNTFSLYVDLPNGSAIKDTREVTACIANILQKEEIVLSTSVFLGQGQPLDFAGMVKGSSLKFEQNQAEMMVNIKKAEERDEKSFKFIQRVRPIVQNTCSLHHANIKFVELPSGPPTLADVVVEVYGGKSSDSRRFFAQKIADILKAQKTLVDIDTLEDEPTKTFELVLNNNKVIESGIGMQQIKRMIYIAIEGSDVGIINDANAQNQIPIFVRIGGDSRLLLRGDKESIQAQTQKLKLMNPSGLAIPLSYFVDVVEKDTIPAIRSKNLKKTTTVFATTDMESQIYPLLDARKMMLEVLSDQYDITKTNLLNLHFEDKKTKESFDIVWDGELKVTIDTFIDLGVAFIGALVLIFLLMVVYYHSYALSAAIVLSSFLSIIGDIL